MSLKVALQPDGYCEETNTIYEYYGDYYHGNPEIFNPDHYNHITKKCFSQLYRETLEREALILQQGYKLITIWENDWQLFKKYITNIGYSRELRNHIVNGCVNIIMYNTSKLIKNNIILNYCEQFPLLSFLLYDEIFEAVKINLNHGLLKLVIKIIKKDLSYLETSILPTNCIVFS